MDKQKYFNSSLKEKEINQNFSETINKFKKRNTYDSKRLLNFQKVNDRRRSVASIKARHSSAIELKPSNTETYKFPQFYHNKVKQYELHPFRRPNLKIVGEDIKYRLFEMNEENNIENNKESKEKELSNIIIDEEFINKKNNLNNMIQEIKIKEKPNLKKEQKKRQNNISGVKIKVIIKKEKKKKVKKNSPRDLESKFLIKYRKLIRVKNLYDSNDDDESEEEKEDQYVINPESKIIILFDFLIIIFFFYYFIYSTINLCKQRCFCQLNKKIILSDIFLFINEILCIIDLIISFFRAYYNFEYKLVKTNRLILIHYLKYDFFFDLLSAIPIFSLSKYICMREINTNLCYKYEIKKNFLFLKLCSVLKTLKIEKIINHKKNQAVENFFELISDSYTIEKIVNILLHSLLYIGILHCIVCIHIFLGSNSFPNWLVMTQVEDEPFHIKYIKSLYFIITTLTTIGYGDITCQSMMERVFQIIILAIGSIFYPYVISTIGNFIKKDSNAQIQLNNKLSMLEKIRKDYPNISFKLYNKIYKYIESKYNYLQKYDANSFIESLPFSFKNSILFTMYNTSITNFIFFKKNNNSIFIAEVLNHFIPCVSKRNEFLIYEGDMVEEIIFIKDGKISLNAAINADDPTASINKYLSENFSPFTTEEEKKLINENINNRSCISLLGDITYDKAKNKLNNAFKTIGNENNIEEKNHFQFNTEIGKKNNYNFDINGGAIINDEGNYNYLKIIDIRKNEHFGCVFITLKKPCPLSLQVKSKIAELFLLKKEPAVNLSKSYPNIWRKLYGKEFHNLRSIKKKTFAALKKYIEVNELFINNNFDDILMTNDITIADLNFLEKSVLGNTSKRHSIYQNSSVKNQELYKTSTLNTEYDNKNKILKINFDALRSNLKAKIKNNAGVKGNSTFNVNKIQLLNHKNFDHSNTNDKNTLAHEINKISKNENIKLNKKKSNTEKLKNLRNFLINSKKYFLNDNLKKVNSNNSHINKESSNFTFLKNSSKKNCLLKSGLPCEFDNNTKNTNKDNLCINSSNKKKVEFKFKDEKEKDNILNNKIINSEQILKELKDICEEETEFSFCSNIRENVQKAKIFSIDKNSNFEIYSSYPNLNKISKGNYIDDANLQKKIKMLIKNYYIFKSQKSDMKDSLSLHTIVFSSGIEGEKQNNEVEYERVIDKYNDKIKHFQTRTLISKTYEKSKKIKKYNSYSIPSKFNKMKNRKRIADKIMNKTSIKNKKNMISKKSLNDTFRNKDNINNIGLFSTFKKLDSNILEEQREENSDSNSIKENKSKTSYPSKNSFIKKMNESSHSNKKYMNKYNTKKIEFFIEKNINKRYSDDKIIINNNSFVSNNYYLTNNHKIYKNRKNRYYNYKKLSNDRDKKIINHMIGMKKPDSNIISNNIITTSSNINEYKNNINSLEKIKKTEESFNIYNIIPKNSHQNVSIKNNIEILSPRQLDKKFCCIL